MVFGLTKATTNYVAGRVSDHFGRKSVLVVVAGCRARALSAYVGTHLGLGDRTNALLGISQGLTWSTTVIMKIDLAGPRQRGLAMG